VTPFLRWAGSKRPIVSRLQRYFPGYPARYVEPFAGSACLFFAIEPKDAVLGDLNSDLISALRVLRQQPREVQSSLSRLPLGKKVYYRIRRLDPKALDDVDAAARFIYLNRYCFNGLYRTNAHGAFNVPYGPPRSRAVRNPRPLQAAATLLQRATLLNEDFEDTLNFARRGDFAYLDPPYAVRSRRMFVDYHPRSFSQKDLARFENALTRLDARGVTFVATYADSIEARDMFARWKPVRIWTRRHIAGFEGARRGSYELLATNIRTRFQNT
jgi:DNA adenine methylase